MMNIDDTGKKNRFPLLKYHKHYSTNEY